MANVKRGLTVRPREWAKHLRPEGKRYFWKTQRKDNDRIINNEANGKWQSFLIPEGFEFGDDWGIIADYWASVGNTYKENLCRKQPWAN